VIPGGGLSPSRVDGKADGRSGKEGNPGGSAGAGGEGESRFFAPAAAAGGEGSEKGETALPAPLGARLDRGEEPAGTAIPPPSGEASDWRRRSVPVRARPGAAASSVEAGGLLLTLGDFARLPDSAAENLFSDLRRRLSGGAEIRDRRLEPAAGLSDCLLALAAPETVLAWSESETAAVGSYLAGGGHIWLDSPDPDRTAAALRRLAAAAGGSPGRLPPDHQLAAAEPVGAVFLENGALAAVSTGRNWRQAWRYGAGDDRDLRFLIRGLNFFLSGDAEEGMELAEEGRPGLRIQPFGVEMPERLAGGAAAGPGDEPWDGLTPGTAWRRAAWSDPGRISDLAPAQGGRALKIDFEEGPGGGRLALYRTLVPPADFSRAAGFRLEAYYDGRAEAGISLILTLPDGRGWRDYETPAQKLGSGWNRLSFDLRDGLFRPLDRGGAFSGELPGREQLGRIGFLIRRRESSAAVLLLREARLGE
jgi:hypothetical protein